MLAAQLKRSTNATTLDETQTCIHSCPRFSSWQNLTQGQQIVIILVATLVFSCLVLSIGLFCCRKRSRSTRANSWHCIWEGKRSRASVGTTGAPPTLRRHDPEAVGDRLRFGIRRPRRTYIISRHRHRRQDSLPQTLTWERFLGNRSA